MICAYCEQEIGESQRWRERIFNKGFIHELPADCIAATREATARECAEIAHRNCCWSTKREIRERFRLSGEGKVQ